MIFSGKVDQETKFVHNYMTETIIGREVFGGSAVLARFKQTIHCNRILDEPKGMDVFF
jgi:hypothetical protein